jgi:hypothetical protein
MGRQPIIYNIDMRNPAGYFLASKFEMRNKGAAVSVLDRRDAVNATVGRAERRPIGHWSTCWR